MKQHHLRYALLSLATIALSASAQSHAMPILTLSPDAHTAAMGGAHLGKAEGQWIYTNPAAFLHTSTTTSVDASSSLFAQQDGTQGRFQLHSLSLAQRIASRQALMLGFRYAGGLHISGYDFNGQPTKTYAPFDWTADLGYVLQWHKCWSASAKASFLYSHLSHNARTVAFGLGLHYHPSPFTIAGRSSTLNTSVQVQNLGPKADYGNDYQALLPGRMALGGNLSSQLAPQHQLEVAAALQHYWSSLQSPSLTTVHLGTGYTYRQQFSARVGWEIAAHQLARATFGIGLRHRALRCNATYLLPTSSQGQACAMLGLGIDF